MNLAKKKVSKTLSNISFINERNRRNNVERAEEAILEEIRVSGGQKAEDPFTRRSTKPRMMTNKAIDIPTAPGQFPPLPGMGKPINPASSIVEANKKQIDDKGKAVPKAKTGDLFSAHNFDIKIDLEVPLPSQPVVVTPKPVANLSATPRRSLNLEDYKKKRGLI